MCSFPQKDTDLLELELVHMVNFPLLWESLVHVSNSDQGVKYCKQRMIILTDSFCSNVSQAFVSLLFLLLLLFLYYNQAGPFCRSFQVIKPN